MIPSSNEVNFQCVPFFLLFFYRPPHRIIGGSWPRPVCCTPCRAPSWLEGGH